MSLGAIPTFWFEFLSDFGENRKDKNWAKTGPFVVAKSTLTVRCGEAKGPEKAPLGSQRRSSATPWRSASPRRNHCSQWTIFGFFIPNTSYLYTNCLGTLLND